MPTRMYFAGVNGGDLEEVTGGNRVLLTFAEYLRGPKLWDRHQEMLEQGQWKGAILDSGAFSELADRKRLEKQYPDPATRPEPFKVPIADYVAFCRDFGHLFEWVANLDDIEGDVETSNSNLAAIQAGAPGVKVVPVFHEGESREQLIHCITEARRNGGLLAVGAQRPKGKLRPTKVVAFLTKLFADLAELDAEDIQVHGFGFPRYAGAFAPKGAPEGGFPLHSVDSTTWNAEGCAAFRAGCTPTRRLAFMAAIDSYQGTGFALGIELGLPIWAVDYDHAAAADRSAHGQARTISARLIAAGVGHLAAAA